MPFLVDLHVDVLSGELRKNPELIDPLDAQVQEVFVKGVSFVQRNAPAHDSVPMVLVSNQFEPAQPVDRAFFDCRYNGWICTLGFLRRRLPG